MKGMGNMMKQAQKLQSKMMKMQEELAEKTVESSSGGGMVQVVANGRQQVRPDDPQAEHHGQHGPALEQPAGLGSHSG